MTETLIEKITKLKRHRNAVVLAHVYTLPEIQALADYVGDSLGLSRTAAETDADVIVFCGVHFMAETASILCPEKTVLIPDADAGCPMADMLTAEQLRQFKDAHPGAAVVSYVNSTAAVKAESDICCTSANAVNVVRSLDPNREVLFVPDRNLGRYVAEQLGRELVLWQGFCPTHENVLPEQVAQAKEAHPDAVVAVHPECRADVVALADFVGSTTGILNFCKESDAKEFIIGTEQGVLYPLERDNSDKSFWMASPVFECPNMKKSTAEKVLWCLEEMQPVVKVEAVLAERARVPIERMIEVVA